MMDHLKERFVCAVAEKLAAVPDGAEKADVVEELADNLCARCRDFMDGGMEPEAAFAGAMEELGDVDELIEYLREARGEAVPGAVEKRSITDCGGDLVDSVEEIVKAAMSRAKAAMDQAGEALRWTGQTGRWRSADGSIELHVRDSARERSRLGGAEVHAAASGEHARLVPADGLRGLDVQSGHGDVTVRVGTGEADAVRICGDVDDLDIKVTEQGILAIRQGRTASGAFLFQRGASYAEVEVELPRGA